MAQVDRTATRIAGFGVAELDFQLMRVLGAACYGGGAPGEIFRTRHDIAGADPAQWPSAFIALAHELDELGRAAALRGHDVSAREHYLRACMYWRVAESFSDPLLAEAGRHGLACRASFQSACRFMAESVEPMAVPFGDIALPGYFMQPADAGGGPRRTILILTGFDGCSEELYFQAGKAALERGYNVAIVEGPGQVGTLRDYPDSVLQPDCETAVAAMLDALLARPEVDAATLAVYGLGLGGYFALRAAAADTRIRALVVNSPIVDLARYTLGCVPDDPAQEADLLLAVVNKVPDNEFPPLQKHRFKASCRRYGVTGYQAWLAALKAYRVEEDHLQRINCPSLALCGESEGAEPIAQFETFCAQAGGAVTRYLFTTQLGADMHCQLGNLPLSNAIVFDWLQDQFR